MSIEVSTRRRHSTLSSQSAGLLGERLSIDIIKNKIDHILSIKQRLSLEDTFFNANTKRVPLREVSGIRNDHIYIEGTRKHGDEILFIRHIHDTLISTVWENIMDILDKNLSSKEVRAINRHFSTHINQTEMRLNPESKKNNYKFSTIKNWESFGFCWSNR